MRRARRPESYPLGSIPVAHRPRTSTPRGQQSTDPAGIATGMRRLRMIGRCLVRWPSGPAPAAGAAAPASAAVLVGRVGIFLLDLGVGPDRLEDHVEIAGHAEPRPQRRGVEPMGAEVMQDGGTVIEHRFDVDELPGPVPFPEDTLAECEAFRADRFGVPGAYHVIRTGRPDHSLPVGGRDRVGPVQRQEDLTQLDPPIRLDHNRLAAPQRTFALRSTRGTVTRDPSHHIGSGRLGSPRPLASSPNVRSRPPGFLSETNRRTGTRPLLALR